MDTHIYAGARGVLEALGRHDCGPALAWCEANRARLRKHKSKLEFKLRVQARALPAARQRPPRPRLNPSAPHLFYFHLLDCLRAGHVPGMCS